MKNQINKVNKAIDSSVMENKLAEIKNRYELLSKDSVFTPVTEAVKEVFENLRYCEREQVLAVFGELFSKNSTLKDAYFSPNNIHSGPSTSEFLHTVLNCHDQHSFMGAIGNFVGNYEGRHIIPDQSDQNCCGDGDMSCGSGDCKGDDGIICLLLLTIFSCCLGIVYFWSRGCASLNRINSEPSSFVKWLKSTGIIAFDAGMLWEIWGTMTEVANHAGTHSLNNHPWYIAGKIGVSFLGVVLTTLVSALIIDKVTTSFNKKNEIVISDPVLRQYDKIESIFTGSCLGSRIFNQINPSTYREFVTDVFNCYFSEFILENNKKDEVAITIEPTRDRFFNSNNNPNNSNESTPLLVSTK